MFFSFYVIYFSPLFAMGKDTGGIYKHNQYQLSTPPFKAPVCSSSASQTSPSIELKTTYIPSVREKNRTILFFVPKIPPRMI